MSRISIHAPREGSDESAEAMLEKEACISIHAPREGSDAARSELGKDADISIHAPREGSDDVLGRGGKLHELFQSTLPVRGATFGGGPLPAGPTHFNPRSP